MTDLQKLIENQIAILQLAQQQLEGGETTVEEDKPKTEKAPKKRRGRPRKTTKEKDEAPKTTEPEEVDLDLTDLDDMRRDEEPAESLKPDTPKITLKVIHDHYKTYLSEGGNKETMRDIFINIGKTKDPKALNPKLFDAVYTAIDSALEDLLNADEAENSEPDFGDFE